MRITRQSKTNSHKEWQSWCLLCAKKGLSTQDLEPIADELCRTIEKHFDVIVNESNLLPKGLCEDCAAFVKMLKEFTERTSRVQRMYGEILVEYQTWKSETLESIREKYIVNTPYGLEAEDVKNEPLEEIKHEKDTGGKEHEKDECEETRPQFDIISPNEMNILEEKDEALSDLLEEFDEGHGCAEDLSLDNSVEDPLDQGTNNAEQLQKPHSRKMKDGNVSGIAEKQNENISRSRKPRTICSEPLVLRCPICSETFSVKLHLRKHMRLKHKESRKFVCFECNTEFPSKYRLSVHEGTHRNPEAKPHKCEICNQHYSTFQALTAHQHLHTNERPFICEQCGFAAKTASSLREHMYSHTEERPFVCDACSKGFKNKHSLRRHFASHSTTRETCGKCGQVLKSWRTYKLHMKTHTEERLHKCSICSRGFKTSKHLKTHLIIHFGIKPFSCLFCNKDFPAQTYVAQHQKSHHREEYLAHIAAGNTHAYIRRQEPSLEKLKALSNAAIQTKEAASATMDSVNNKSARYVEKIYELKDFDNETV